MGQRPSLPADLAQIEELRQQLRAMEMQRERTTHSVEKEQPPPPYRYGSQSVSPSTVEAWEKELMQDPKNKLALSALTSNSINAIVRQKAATFSDSQIYNIKIPFEGAPITNQNSSGRCWLFASTNVFRVAIMKKHNLKSFELSQAYLFFWDKFEKANYFLEQAIDTAGDELDSRLIQSLFAAPINDGGQWDMVVNLVRKYGLVPQALYPDAYHAKSSSEINRLITAKVREYALVLRSMASSESLTKDSIMTVKEEMLKEVYLALTLTLGAPPKPRNEFTWEYYDAHDNYHKVNKTPVEFAHELSTSASVRTIGADVSDLFSLVNDPRNKYGQLMTVKRLGNVYGARPVTYVNVDMITMKKAAIKMLQAGLPVFFGSDVGKYSDSTSGIMDTALFDYSLAFNVSLNMNKAQRLRTGESAMTHAMVLTAVQVEDGKSVRWRVQNSWGSSAGDEGFFVMSDKWMDEFTYQVVVDPNFVTKEIRDVLKKKPLELELWDPMGALA